MDGKVCVMLKRSSIAIVRGGGDLATGIIYRLHKVGFRVICLETDNPLAVRRTVSAAEAVYDGNALIDGMRVRKVDTLPSDDEGFYEEVPLLVDPMANILKTIRPDILIDAIMAKKNLGTNKSMAPIVVAIGPGFSAPDEVDAVIETKRGHYLGRVITKGSAIPNTGIPGIEMGYSIERLLRSPGDGFFSPHVSIGDMVKKGQIVGRVEDMDVNAGLDGVIRGLIHPRAPVTKGLKIGDVDPRGDKSHCFSITDKALAIAGGVLEAIFSLTPRSL